MQTANVRQLVGQKGPYYPTIVTLENKLKELEQNPDCIFDHNYLDYKSKLDQIYEEKANGVKIRSKCEWYKFGEILT